MKSCHVDVGLDQTFQLNFYKFYDKSISVNDLHTL